MYMGNDGMQNLLNGKELMRAGNNFLRCTDAEGGRERPGKALLGAGRPRIGGVNKMPPSLGAGATARSAGALRTAFLAARSSAGPRSGRARDGISRIRSAYRRFKRNS